MLILLAKTKTLEHKINKHKTNEHKINNSMDMDIDMECFIICLLMDTRIDSNLKLE